MSQASPAKESPISPKEPSMEEILASIRRIIEGGEERPALAQRTRERLAAAAAGSAYAGAQTRPSAADPAAASFADAEPDEAPPRLFAPANGLQRPDLDRGTSPPTTDADPHAATAEAMSVETSPAGFDAGEASASSTEAPDLASLATEMAIPPNDASYQALAGVEDALSELEATPPPHPEAYWPVRHEQAEDGAEAETQRDAAGFDPPAEYEEPEQSVAAAAPYGDEAVVALEEDRSADLLELPDFSLEFDEESFSAELRGEVGLDVPAASQPEPEPYLAAALAEAANSPAPAFSAPASLIAETSSLMSEEAGAQVAAAFDDLARAIREGQMKTMEEMTRQMLRPMLQEWLDDNLPRLVEKLVREEIERVSRGGRR